MVNLGTAIGRLALGEDGDLYAEADEQKADGVGRTTAGTSAETPSGAGSRRARPRSLTAQVVEFIEELCVAPGAAPGDQLPAEGELAARFGVSRVVLREAMKSLEARGLVERRQGKAAVIASPNALPVENFVALAVLRDRRALLEFTEVRTALEVHGARLAARRVAGPDHDDAQEHLARARAAIDELLSDPADMPTRLRTDVTFHQAVAAASGNASLAQILDALERTLAESRHESHRRYLATGAEPAGSAAEHEELLEAVLSGDPSRAATAMEEHLHVTMQEIETRPPDDGEPRPNP